MSAQPGAWLGQLNTLQALEQARERAMPVADAQALIDNYREPLAPKKGISKSFLQESLGVFDQQHFFRRSATSTATHSRSAGFIG